MNKQFTISEYSCIAKGKRNEIVGSNLLLQEKYFDDIEYFILKSNKESNLSDFFTISYRVDLGKVIQAKNYVGIIQLKNNISIEILPKIYLTKSNQEANEIEQVRKIFLRMLISLGETQFKQFGSTHLKSLKMPLFEVFVFMFLEELSLIIKRGVKSGYVQKQDNTKYLKGSLLVNHHIRLNSIKKDKFFVSYDEFLPDIPENRLIKRTLEYLLINSHNTNNLKRIQLFLNILLNIDCSTNIDKDIQSCSFNRLMSGYANILKWCSIFLRNKSFLNYRGSNIAFALLFPMEKIFESFIGKELKRSSIFDTVKLQHNKFSLLREISGRNSYSKMIPDIVAFNEDSIYIIDTKWKLLDENLFRYGIKESDLYQLFAYGKIYEDMYPNWKVHLVLLYPKTERFDKKRDFEYTTISGIPLAIFPFGLETKRDSIQNMINEIM